MSITMALWFAWKIVLLQYHKHPYLRFAKTSIGCDLLEKSYFCSITNIPLRHFVPHYAVVICLKNRTFAVSQTSICSKLASIVWLWFAWKIVLLQYHKHLSPNIGMFSDSCDLLEKSYFCSITNINVIKIIRKIALWFAWKIVLLQYHKHQLAQRLRKHNRCDLLEKSYFCSITNIQKEFQDYIQSVVICLKNRTFAVSQTSVMLDGTYPFRLWFAWKIVLLQYHKHQEIDKRDFRYRCDLLEKSYFCSITNIILELPPNMLAVVICLKNRTFAVSQTSYSPRQAHHV